MAKKITKVLKLQIQGGKATPQPPLGPTLGQAGVNIGEFTKQFNDETKDKMGEVVSVVLTVYDDRTFTYIIKTAPVSSMIMKALNLKGGSGKNKTKKVGKLTQDQLRSIAQEKLPDLNANTVEAAMNIVAGSARSMGVEIAQ